MAGRKGGGFLRVLLFPLTLVVGLVLPFCLLLFLSVQLYKQFHLPWQLNLAIGILILGVGLYFYAGWLWRTLKGKKKLAAKGKRFSFRLALVLTGVYTAYSLLFLGIVHAKTEEVRGEYESLHPLLRLAVGAVVIFDQKMILTDLSRTHEDYGDMGLADKKNSLHYPQSDGWVHAADLRTQGRAEWRNVADELFLKSMGLNVHRHGGTGDHLHVSLSIPENPAAW